LVPSPCRVHGSRSATKVSILLVTNAKMVHHVLSAKMIYYIPVLAVSSHFSVAARH
jgi:hypothetical protein